MSTAAISLRGVTKRYGPQLALTPTDLEIDEGEFFCLLGPSGCGKTTTLNLIGGFVAPSAGEILIRGKRVDRLPPYRSRSTPSSSPTRSSRTCPSTTTSRSASRWRGCRTTRPARGSRRSSSSAWRNLATGFPASSPADSSSGSPSRAHS